MAPHPHRNRTHHHAPRRHSDVAALVRAEREVRNFGFAVMAGLACCIAVGAASVGMIDTAIHGSARA